MSTLEDATATVAAAKGGLVLEPGYVILAGGAIALQLGMNVRVSVETLGAASFTLRA